MSIFGGFFSTREERLLYKVIATQERLIVNAQEILAKLTAANTSLDNVRADVARLLARIEAGADLTEIGVAVTELASKLAETDASVPEDDGA